MINQVIHGDCLEEMKRIPDKSVDMILCDLPYGTTACSWDTIIPFEPLWAQYKRIIKDNGAIVLTASQPFTTDLINSNRDWFRYEWIWQKSNGGGFLLANKMPIKRHENILIYYDNPPIYNPQFIKGKPYTTRSSSGGGFVGEKTSDKISGWVTNNDGKRYPISVLNMPNPSSKANHPTQKPVALFEYLIRTYTNPGDLVLDNCAGSGTTAIACIKSDRDYILIEKEEKYIKIINKRIKQERSQMKLL